MLLSKEDLAELELTQKQFTSAITRSQKEIEAWHFSTRKHLFDYDSVIDKQRKRIYFMRDSIIEANEDEVLFEDMGGKEAPIEKRKKGKGKRIS